MSPQDSVLPDLAAYAFFNDSDASRWLNDVHRCHAAPTPLKVSVAFSDSARNDNDFRL